MNNGLHMISEVGTYMLIILPALCVIGSWVPFPFTKDVVYSFMHFTPSSKYLMLHNKTQTIRVLRVSQHNDTNAPNKLLK